jgi:hypothetical protein
MYETDNAAVLHNIISVVTVHILKFDILIHFHIIYLFCVKGTN